MLALSRTRTSGIVAAFQPALTKAAVVAKWAVVWPVRAIRARRHLAQLSELSDHELKDFGLLRSDLGAVHSVSELQQVQQHKRFQGRGDLSVLTRIWHIDMGMSLWV